MKIDYFETQSKEGVFGPQIVLNALSGHSCLRFEDGKVIGNSPDAPMTNAFLVWVGWPVIVVSEGVRAEDLPDVAKQLRKAVHADTIVPVVATTGRLADGTGARAVSDNPNLRARRDLAKAQAYVEVQCAWAEEMITIEMDDERFKFLVMFRQVSPGRYSPLVE
jgi:hypothetical protein